MRDTEIEKAIKASRYLDPTIGFLHELAQSKTPLVYDIQEMAS
jgi:CRISPR/Cas system-associated endonuclease Cas1